MAARANVTRSMRRLYNSSYFSQSWSFYLEKLFEDEGYFETLPHMENLKTQMARRQMRMWRVQRILTKLKMAKGEMTFDQAVQAYIDKIGMERTNAFIEVQRDSQSPSPPGREIIGDVPSQTSRHVPIHLVEISVVDRRELAGSDVVMVAPKCPGTEVREFARSLDGFEVSAAAVEIEGCDGVIVGASIRYGHYAACLEPLIRDHREAIVARPNAFFSVCLTAGGPGARPTAAQPYLDDHKANTPGNPRPIAIIGITAPTPKMIPSIVKALRS